MSYDGTPRSGYDHNVQSLGAVYAALKSALRSEYPEGSNASRTSSLGKIYAFTSPTSNAGTSFVARSMAENAAQSLLDAVPNPSVDQADTPKRILLLDMDVSSNSPSSYYFNQAQMDGYALPHGPYDAVFEQTPFWRVTPSMVGSDGKNTTDSHFMCQYMLHHLPLSFLHFRWDLFTQGQSVHVHNARQYWHALRGNFDAIFIDTPSTDRSTIGSTVFGEVDTNIIVCAPDQTGSAGLDALTTQIKSSGGHCSGVILNQKPPIPSDQSCENVQS